MLGSASRTCGGRRPRSTLIIRAGRDHQDPAPRSAVRHAPLNGFTTPAARRHRRHELHGARRRRHRFRVKNLSIGDRVRQPSRLACGNCMLCKEGSLLALRKTSTRSVDGEKLLGQSSCRHLRLLAHGRRLFRRTGGSRVRKRDVGPSRCPTALTGRAGAFLSDIFRRDTWPRTVRHPPRRQRSPVWGLTGPSGEVDQELRHVGCGRVIRHRPLPENGCGWPRPSRAEVI